MIHGVSATSNGGSTAPPPAALSKQRRYSSRSNSLSSSSMVTIKPPGSHSSSSTGARSSTASSAVQSPAEPSLIALRLPQDHRRRKSVAVDLSEHGSSEGLNNLNRWSHSTNSSAASIGNTRRSRASSGAALQQQIGTAQHYSSPTRNRSRVDGESPRSSPHRKTPSSRSLQQRPLYSPEPGAHRLRQKPSRPEFANSITALPPLHTTPALTDPNDTESPSTIQTITTPSTQSSYAPDYFGDDSVSPRNAAKYKRPIVIRNHTAPMAVPQHSRNPAPEPVPAAEPVRRSSVYESQGHQDSRTVAMHENSGHGRTRTREGKERDKKAMLTKALQKANTAVLLDNAQNFEGALDAYCDACLLLQQVMDRSSGADDKRKLEAIRVTYTNRIEELRQLDLERPPTSDDKGLPARPMSDDSIAMSPTDGVRNLNDDSVRDSAVIETATMTRIIDVPRLSYPEKNRDSFFARTMDAVDASARETGGIQRENEVAELPAEVPERPATTHVEEEAYDVDAGREEDDTPAVRQQMLHIPPPSENSKYMPAPLSPRKPLSPQLKPEAEQAWNEEPEHIDDLDRKKTEPNEESNETSNEAAGSWLDTIDESESSCASSVHSVSSKSGLRRKHLRGASGETDPGFTAAFDAAVEAAYDEGLEPDMDAGVKRRTANKHVAKESIIVSPSEIKEVLSPTNDFHPMSSLNMEMDDEEEERLLDEITSDYAQGFDFDLSSKSALPRQSDSSGYSRSTWQSSSLSTDRTTANTSLSTVAEDVLGSPRLVETTTMTEPPIKTVLADPAPPRGPPPTAALPRPPSTSGNRLSGVRGRRLSGVSNPKQLKIETFTQPETRKRASTYHHSPSPQVDNDEKTAALETDSKFGSSLEPTPSETQHEHILQSPPSLDMLSAASDTSRPLTTPAEVDESPSNLDDAPRELRSIRPNVFRKNKSSLSLREQTSTISSPEEFQPPLATPMSSTYASFTSKRSQDPLISHRSKESSRDVSGPYIGGAYLFDTTLLSAANRPTSPRSPTSSNYPLGLEACPESQLLRPFWLMRVIGSTLTHPKGGYITTRLFVPREVWHTRNVKLKSIEDKIANCDLLTAALGRLAGVDTYDADAVMEELQGFEEVMERVQASLAKKLGSDVGVHGLAGMFRDAPSATGAGSTANVNGLGAAAGGADAAASTEKSSRSKEGKSYLNSWRKLRSKSSGTPLSSISQQPRFDSKEPLTMSSVPMTSFMPVERRGHKKDPRNLAFDGPNKEYMGSLARLFDGAQVLDQIARQVEDPGLKHSSPTHVGLELSIRHAAEFFAFYVCRFVLADVGTLVDKFVKRGTEWVLA